MPLGPLLLLLGGAAAAAPAPVKIVRNSDVIDFTYEWPREAAAVPALDRTFRAEAEHAYRNALPLAREDHAGYVREGRQTVHDFYAKKWTTAGSTPRLLALQFEGSTYTGGAHPNTGYGALLWDRAAAREVGVASLFRSPTALTALTRPQYCTLLNRQRAKRRQDWQPSIVEFTACPPFRVLAVSPVDSDRNGRFDLIEFVASPYTAGPYAEGKYAVRVRVTPVIMRALKPDYAPSFEAQRQ